MHWTNLNNVARLFALQYAVSTTTRHSRDIQKLRSVDHVIVYQKSACHLPTT
jgi:hypothetical protein